MKRYLPLLFGVLVLIIVNSNISKQEQIIRTGESIFVKLHSINPRSLLQGDYMALAYNLNIDKASLADIKDNKSSAQISLLSYQLIITLDEQQRVISSTFNEPKPLADNQHKLIVKKPGRESWQTNFYPANNSFFFAEGLAKCYAQAEYAELKVVETGKPLLYRLTDGNLLPLNCENQPQ